MRDVHRVLLTRVVIIDTGDPDDAGVRIYGRHSELLRCSVLIRLVEARAEVIGCTRQGPGVTEKCVVLVLRVVGLPRNSSLIVGGDGRDGHIAASRLYLERRDAVRVIRGQLLRMGDPELARRRVRVGEVVVA